MKTEIKLLENWAFGMPDMDPYTPPELQLPVFWGDVNGKSIQTSAIQGCEPDGIIVTVNSRYKLGEPKEDYEEMFPDAKNRVLKVLKEHENQ